ncbi:MAG: GIY-YIG nuclease family protein [Candidatus Methanomethylophilaceae archaeon]|nr:GIY-YIG nuclease family protein [Candidatus Methanomethylophilaceae archaeon]
MSDSKSPISSARLDSVKSSVLRGKFVSADRFLSIYDDRLHSRRIPGCYVILVYKGRHASRNPENYLMGYVGQSVNVFSRVHEHLVGEGNEGVRSAIKAGRRVMVQPFPCSAESLNDMERLLIAAMSRDRLYNMTDGGSAWRCRDRSDFILADKRLTFDWDSPPMPLCRTLASCYGRSGRIRLRVDGIPVSTLSDGSLISFDLPKGPHSIKASRIGRSSGTMEASIGDGCEIVVSSGMLKVGVKVLRRRQDVPVPSKQSRREDCLEFRNPES